MFFSFVRINILLCFTDTSKNAHLLALHIFSKLYVQVLAIQANTAMNSSNLNTLMAACATQTTQTTEMTV